MIGEFDEGFSNRQTWHNAALAAIAIWFEDEELLTRAVQAPTGMLAHSCRASATTACGTRARTTTSSRCAGSSRRWAGRGRPGSTCSRTSALPPGWPRRSGRPPSPRCPITPSRPARTRGSGSRWRSRCTSSSGRSASPAWADESDPLWSWLRELYAAPAPEAGTFDSYLHEAGRARRRRTAQPRRSVLVVAARDGARAAGVAASRGRPGPCCSRSRGSRFCATGRRYASLECGRLGGGHGHPDRLNLTLHADGDHWLRRSRGRLVCRPDLSGIARPWHTTRPGSTARSQHPGDARLRMRSTCATAGAGPAGASAT